MTVGNRRNWDEMCEVIKWHNHLHDCCIDTLNRLLREKPVNRKKTRELVMLDRSELDVSEETWTTEMLWSLLDESQRVDDPPDRFDRAVVVLRWKGIDYLMDGRRRVNYWHRNLIPGPHRVLVVHESTK